MAEPGLTTPVQPVRPGAGRGRGVVAVGLALIGLVTLLAWHPWTSGATPSSRNPPVSTPAIGVASTAPSAVPSDVGLPSDLLGGPTTGPWSGRVAGIWSIVAFLRADPVSRDPLDLRQLPVTVFTGPVHPPVSRAPEYCDTVGPTRDRSAAELPTREVRFLGIAFPADRTVGVEGVVRLGKDVGAIPVELGRIPGAGIGDVASPSASSAGGGSPSPSGSPSADPVRMFALPAVDRGRTASIALTCHGRWPAGAAVRLYPSLTAVAARPPTGCGP